MTRSRTPSLEKAIDAVTLVASNPPRPARQNAANQNVLIISTPKLNRERDQSTLIWCCAQLEMSFCAAGIGMLVNVRAVERIGMRSSALMISYRSDCP